MISKSIILVILRPRSQWLEALQQQMASKWFCSITPGLPIFKGYLIHNVTNPCLIGRVGTQILVECLNCCILTVFRSLVTPQGSHENNSSRGGPHHSRPAVSFGCRLPQPSRLTISVLLTCYLLILYYKNPKHVGWTLKIPCKHLQTNGLHALVAFANPPQSMVGLSNPPTPRN